MKHLKSLIFLFILTLLAGCVDEQSLNVHTLTGTSYTGVLPCADCEGIAYKLTFKEDRRFEATSVYIGKSNRSFTERGQWSLQGDSLLILDKSEEDARQFKINNGQLIMLDRQGTEVSGSLSKMYVLDESDAEQTDGRWEKLKKRGIDFRAAGNEPFWGLEINFGKMIAFHTLDGDSVSALIPKMEQDSASKARRWRTTVDSDSLIVAIYPTGCVDNMSGEVFNYLVKVTYADREYSGCGSFINDVFKLNDFWELEMLAGDEVTEQTKGKVPALQFDIAANKVYGNTGCNQLSGTISAQDHSFIFSQILTTKMACPGSLEPEFLEALQKVSSYSIVNAKLLLIGRQDTLMRFHRAQ